MNPFDYIKSINSKEIYYEDLKEFSLWLTGKLFSAHKDFVFAANIINQLNVNKLPKMALYDFFYYVIPKNRQWIKYPKSESTMKHIKYVMGWFGCDETVAKQYLKVISKEELTKIKDYNEKRGVN